METALIALALIPAAIIGTLAIPLAILATGIRRQEHAGSLTANPRGISATLTSRVVGLHTARTTDPGQHRPPGRGQSAATTRPEARQA
jgi:hypothetical protein